MNRWSQKIGRALLLALFTLAGPIGPARAADKSGLDPSRLKLPKGPGSIEGLGENADPSVNMGTVSYSVPTSLPAGQGGFGPSLKVAYHSGDGNSELGLGWSLGLSTIERMTSFGLPSYTANDRFAANGGEELVRLPGTSYYRARYEGGFVRYSWLKAPDGKDGYWKAEYPDGSVGYFGADSSGNISAARASAPGIGTFSYFLVERWDVLGHRIRYDYNMDGARPLLAAISWAFTSGGVPRYVVQVDYEARADTVQGDKLFDGKPGFALPLTKRVNAITLLVHGAQTSRHVLQYEPYATTGGLTRLASVTSYGTDSTPAIDAWTRERVERPANRNERPAIERQGGRGRSVGRRDARRRCGRTGQGRAARGMERCCPGARSMQQLGLVPGEGVRAVIPARLRGGSGRLTEDGEARPRVAEHGEHGEAWGVGHGRSGQGAGVRSAAPREVRQRSGNGELDVAAGCDTRREKDLLAPPWPSSCWRALPSDRQKEGPFRCRELDRKGQRVRELIPEGKDADEMSGPVTDRAPRRALPRGDAQLRSKGGDQVSRKAASELVFTHQRRRG